MPAIEPAFYFYQRMRRAVLLAEFTLDSDKREQLLDEAEEAMFRFLKLTAPKGARGH